MMTTNMRKYETAERYARHSDDMATIAAFIVWLEREKLVGLVKLADGGDVRLRQLLLEYFDIDPAELERERRALLEEVRK